MVCAFQEYTGFFRQGNLKTLQIFISSGIRKKNRIWLNLSNSDGAFKQTLVGYIEGATNAIDQVLTASYSTQTHCRLYSIDGKIWLYKVTFYFMMMTKLFWDTTVTLNGIFGKWY
jgi:hypothetical protein